MPFVLLIFGSVLLIAAVRNTQGDLFALIQSDFTGPNNFIYWLVAILVIGAVGYIPKLKPISVAFITLVVVMLVFSKGVATNLPGGGIFQQFTAGLASTQTTTSTVTNSAGQTTTQPTTINPVPVLNLPNLGGS